METQQTGAESFESEEDLISQIEARLKAAPEDPRRREVKELSAQGTSEETPSPETEPEAIEEAPAETEEPAKPFLLTDLAKESDFSEAELLQTLHVPGKDGTLVPIGKALEEWRTPAPDLTQREQQRIAQFDQAEAQRQQAVAQHIEQLRSLGLMHARQLQLEEPNWVQLEKSVQPQEYAYARIKWNERIETLKNTAAELDRAQQAEAQRQQQRVAQMRQESVRRLKEAVPDWKDPAKFRTGLQAVENYIIAQGFTPEEVSNLIDHRDWLVARKAMLWDELQSKRPLAQRRVAQIPRLVRPGQPTSRGDERARAEQKTLESLSKNGSDEAGMDYVMTLLQKESRGGRRSA